MHAVGDGIAGCFDLEVFRGDRLMTACAVRQVVYGYQSKPVSRQNDRD